MKYLSYLLLIVSAWACTPVQKEKKVTFQTVCNPMNLSYRFRPETNEVSRREAADPTIIRFKDDYWLFASKSGGYWYSSDLTDWTFVETNEIPTEEYAPCAVVLNDTVFFLASSRSKSTIYKSADPKSGKWQIACAELDQPVWDPSFLLDDDGKLYLYHGCSNETPIWGVELDVKNNFSFVGEATELISAHPKKYGWEVPGDYNDQKETAPWIEGAWMNKYNGTYYLQYAGPGTQYKSYSDGVYTSENPLGPFKLQDVNPFAYKPEGFAAGAGHGSTFDDKFGNIWHIGTITISQKHMFERRLGLYPTFIDEAGALYANTRFGDYPMIIPDKKVKNPDELFPGWMLLSYGKQVKVSSTEQGFDAVNINDEDIRTYWAATSGSDKEWASIDLGEDCDVYAVQVNFADHKTHLYNRQPNIRHRYIIEGSNDENKWETVIDKSQNNNDRTHQYTQLENKVNYRFIRIKNLEVPDGNFAISGFRIFGLGRGEKPQAVNNFKANRNTDDRREVQLSWESVKNATGYNISYGTAKDKLFLNYKVYNTNEITIKSLNAGLDYFFAIEAFNENGISPMIIPN